MRQSKNRVEILYWQQFIQACFLPFILPLPIARSTMAVVATVILVMHMLALTVATMVVMIAQSSGATLA